MSGHNKWSKIKHKKEVSDSKKSKIFSKLVRYLTVESKKASGDVNMPGLRLAIAKAKEANMPIENIERAVKKGSTDTSESMENITYEAYGPGGSAIIIEALTENRNKAAQEIKHILSKNGFSLAGMGSVTWSFKRNDRVWTATQTMSLPDEDLEKLEILVEQLEDNDEVQDVYTNVE